MGYLNPSSIIGSVGLILILSLGAYGWTQNKRAIHWQEEYYQFVATTKAAGEIAEAERVRKEAQYREAFKTAEFARDAALNRLRDDRESARRRAMSVTPIGSQGRVCFDRAKFDAVLQSFLGEVEAGLARGDCSIIESKACYEAWPNIH